MINEFEIEDINHDGDGVARLNNRVYFIRHAIIGDVVSIKNIEEKKNYVKANLDKIIKKSPYRLSDDRRFLSALPLYNMDYLAELDWKKNKVKSNLYKIAHIDIPDIDIEKSDEILRYRNNVQIAVENRNGEVLSGIYDRGENKVIDCEYIPFFDDDLQSLYKKIRLYIKKNFSGYSFEDDSGDIKHIVFRKNRKNDIMLIFVSRENIDIDVDYLLKESNGMIKSIYLNINGQRSSKLYSDKFIKIFGQDCIEENICDIEFEISPQSFFQVNTKVAEKMYKEAINMLDIHKNETILDLYSGIGTITLNMALKAKEVIGVEFVDRAVDDASKAAKKNSIKNAYFINKKTEDKISFILKEHNVDKILTDPPRKGMDRKVVDELYSSDIEKIVYISCDSASFARDLSILKGKYKIEKIKLFDMFPRTSHVETIVLLSKLDSKRHISVELPIDEMDLTSAESNATYKQIQNYVFEKFGFKVSTLHIAQVKKKHGLEVREHYNISKNEKQKVPQCSIEKEEAILDALKHFKMV